jgi:hypothetical protein
MRDGTLFATRWLPVLCASALLGMGCVACGGSGGGAGPAPTSSASGSSSRAAGGGGTIAQSAPAARLPEIELKGDDDSDSDNYPHEPQNDNENELLGHPAGVVDVRAVTALVRGYYRAAAARDGGEACRLMYAPLAESVAEDYGADAGPASLRGVTCASVLAKLFSQRRRRLGAESTTLKVAQVRILGKRGSVRLGFAGIKQPHYLIIHRERGRWKVDMLLDVERPIRIE